MMGERGEDSIFFEVLLKRERERKSDDEVKIVSLVYSRFLWEPDSVSVDSMRASDRQMFSLMRPIKQTTDMLVRQEDMCRLGEIGWQEADSAW
jgi:hypothetical protein